MDNRAQVASQFIEAALIDCDRRPSQLGNDKNSIDPIIDCPVSKRPRRDVSRKHCFYLSYFKEDVSPSGTAITRSTGGRGGLLGGKFTRQS